MLAEAAELAGELNRTRHEQMYGSCHLRLAQKRLRIAAASGYYVVTFSLYNMLNYIWATLLFIGLLVAGLVGRVSGDASVIDAAMKGAEKAVMGIALPLAGMMMFWLGVLRLLEKAGVLEAVVRLLSPLLRRLFPGRYPRATRP